MSDNNPIQGVSASGKAPKCRIKDAAGAWDMMDQLATADSTAARYRAQIQGLIDGNSPYSAGELQRMGQMYRSNVNFREAEAIIDTNAASIFELDMEVPTLINVALDKQDPSRPGNDYAQIIASEYTRTVLGWPDYHFNRMLSIREMLVFGIGPMFWQDKWDWRPRAVKRSALIIPADSKATTGEIELIGFRHSYQAHELFRMIDDDKKKELAEEEGWNTTLLLDAIQKANKVAADDKARYSASEVEAFQQRLKNNDLAASITTCEPIRVRHILVKEYSGKVTHLIIHETEKYSEYLYEGYEEYDDMRHALCMFIWNVGDGYYRSIKGLGHRIFPHVEMSNRFINTTVDGAGMSSSLIIQPQPGRSQQAINLLRLGPLTVMPEGFDAIQNTFAPNLTGIIGVRTMLQQILNNNTGVYKKALEGPDLPSRTAKEVTIEEMRSARLEKNQVASHYIHSDAMHTEIFRRLTNKDYPEDAEGWKQAKEFRKRCKDKGVPPEFLSPEACRVSATRAIGYGSASMRDMVTTQVLQLSAHSSVDEIGKRNALRDRLAALVGHSMVDRYAPEASRDLIPTSESSLAALENNDMASGKQALVGTDQPHVLHWQIHMPMVQQILQAFMQAPHQMNIMAAVPAVGSGIQHLSAHLQALSSDPLRKGQVNQMGAELAEMQKVFAVMQRNAERIQQEQAAAAEAQARATPTKEQMEWQAKQIELENKARLGFFKEQNRDGVAREKAQNQAELAAAELQAKIRRQDFEDRVLT